MRLSRPGLAALALLGLALASRAPDPGPQAASRSVREQVELLESQVADLEQRILALQEVDGRASEERAAQDDRVRELREALALDSPNRRTPADLAARLDTVETDLRVVFEQQNELTMRVSVLADKVDALYRQRLAPPPAPVDPLAPGVVPETIDPETIPDEDVSRGADARVPLVDPEELYQAARSDYGRGSYELAAAGFQEFLDRFPESELADNAEYWVGECHYAQADHDQAIASFDRVIERYPDGDKAADAEYKKGLALLELNRTAEGIVQLQRTRERHPDTPAGRLARSKLQALGLL